MSHVVAIVQSRTGSSRLPGKALKVLSGQPMVLHVLARVAAMGYPTWLATSLAPADDRLADLVIRAGYPVFRGDERDVLGRTRQAAEAAQADVVIRATGDCPCFAPDVGEMVLALYRANATRLCIATNDTTRSGYPDGLDVEVFPMELLQYADAHAESPVDGVPVKHDREHVTPLMRRVAAHHVLDLMEEDWRAVKVSVDTAEDFERVRQVHGLLDGGGYGWAATRAALQRWQQKEGR